MNVSVEFFTHLVWIVSLIFNLGRCSPSFMRSVVIHNLLCPSAADIDFGQLRSGLQCAQKCYNDVDCQGFFYKVTGTCLGSTVNVSSPIGCSTETGTKYYFGTELSGTTTTGAPTVPTTTAGPTTAGFPPAQTATASVPQSCLMDNDCTRPHQYCHSNFLCTCKPGYSQNPSTLSCTDGCAVYGTTYLYYMYKGLADPSGVMYTSHSLLQCKQLCIDTNCRGFSYNFIHSRCLLSDETAVTIPVSYAPHAEVDYYNRNCA